MGCSLSRFKRLKPDDDHRNLDGTQQKKSGSAWSRFFYPSSNTAANPQLDSDTDNLNQQQLHNPTSTSVPDIHSSSIRAEDASHDHHDHQDHPSEVSGVAVHFSLAPFLVSPINQPTLTRPLQHQHNPKSALLMPTAPVTVPCQVSTRTAFSSDRLSLLIAHSIALARP